MNLKLLLKPLDNGFNYDAIKEIESLCADCIVKASPNDSPFIFIVRQVCFDLGETIEGIDGSVGLHDKIEQSILPALTKLIISLDDGAISDRLDEAHNLINALRIVRAEIKK